MLTNSRSYIAIYSDCVLFVERANELCVFARLRTYGLKPERKRVGNRREVNTCRPETGRPIHGQIEVSVTGNGGSNPRTLKSAGMSCG